MSKDKKNLLNITPMEHYEAPKVPTLEDVYKNPEPLKKLPARWAKNAVVVASVGALGMTTLSGCFSRPLDDWRDFPHHGGAGSAAYFVYPTEQEVYEDEYCSGYGLGYNGYEEFDLVVRIHHGGSGTANYVVHLTEQEALGIIRKQLEAVGLTFCDTPPDYAAFEGDAWMPNIELDLFDAENNVAISRISWEDNHRQFIHRITREVEEGFARQTDITVGVFETPGFFPQTLDAMGDWFENDDGEWEYAPPDEPTDEEKAEAKAEARPILEANLNQQIQEFINLLRAEGIIQ
ncbi:MAG: hypothetical protein FWD97_07995 [Defluviitaleaceae bacterium]|nr:hypothetical protein [Defluviitaleaceae bacterium]